MNNKLKELAVEAGISFIPYMESDGCDEDHPDSIHNLHLERFAALVADEAFRQGILYIAKKYENAIGDSRYSHSDVKIFCEMESVEADFDLDKFCQQTQ